MNDATSPGSVSAGNPSSAGQPGSASEGQYARGGPIVDRMTLPGLRERITAHEGEFIVQRGPAVKYRRLLEAINADDPTRITRQARTLREAMTR